MEKEKVKKNTKKVKTKTPVPLETTIYNIKGKEAGKILLPERVFGLKWNSDLVHQVVTSMESSARTNGMFPEVVKNHGNRRELVVLDTVLYVHLYGLVEE